MTIKKVVEDFFRNFFNKNHSLPFSIRMEETGMYYMEQFDFVEVDGERFPILSLNGKFFVIKINNGNKILVVTFPKNIDENSSIFIYSEEYSVDKTTEGMRNIKQKQFPAVKLIIKNKKDTKTTKTIYLFKKKNPPKLNGWDGIEA